MRLLAIDPSLRSTGIAGLGWAEHIATKGMSGNDRLAYILNYLRDFYRGTDVAIVEQPLAGGRGASTYALVGLYQLITFDLWKHGIQVAEVHPNTLKMFATNNGRAEKAEVAAAMLEVHPTMTFDSDDESDAYALLTMGHQYYALHMSCCGGGDHKVIEHNRTGQALNSVDWPESDLRRRINAALERRD